jgi:hypothetical protein
LRVRFTRARPRKTRKRPSNLGPCDLKLIIVSYSLKIAIDDIIREQPPSNLPLHLVSGVVILYNRPNFVSHIRPKAIARIQEKFVHIFIISDNSLRLLLSLKCFKKFIDIISWLFKEWGGSLKIHLPNFFFLRIYVPMDHMITFIHNPFEFLKFISVWLNRLSEAIALVG